MLPNLISFSVLSVSDLFLFVVSEGSVGRCSHRFRRSSARRRAESSAGCWVLSCLCSSVDWDSFHPEPLHPGPLFLHRRKHTAGTFTTPALRSVTAARYHSRSSSSVGNHLHDVCLHDLSFTRHDGIRCPSPGTLSYYALFPLTLTLSFIVLMSLRRPMVRENWTFSGTSGS